MKKQEVKQEIIKKEIIVKKPRKVSTLKKEPKLSFMFFVLIGSYLEKNPEKDKVVLEELKQYFKKDFKLKQKQFADRGKIKKDLEIYGKLLNAKIVGIEELNFNMPTASVKKPKRGKKVNLEGLKLKDLKYEDVG